MEYIHALRYARTAPEARDKSICLRHDSKYAALVSCGVYKGKKNKALVAIARDEWKLTAASKKAFSKGLWIRHVKVGTQIMSGTTLRISSREMATSGGARTADRLGHSVPSSADTEIRMLAPSRRRRPAPLAGRREGGESGPPDLAFGRGQLLTHNPG